VTAPVVLLLMVSSSPFVALAVNVYEVFVLDTKLK
jgi:hypothetical protein